MEKLYTKEEYAEKAIQASNEGKKLFKVQGIVDYDVEVYEYEKKTIKVPIYEGEEIVGYEDKEVDDLDKPIMIETTDPETGETVMVHKHHTETRQKLAETLDIRLDGYYICSKDNITDGTLNPDFADEQEEKAKQARIKEIKAELDLIDSKSVRPLRAGETERLAQLEAQAVELRSELAELT